MGVILVYPAAFSGSSAGSSTDGHSHSNFSTLSKLATNPNGDLTFNGKVVSVSSLEVGYNLTLSETHISQKFFPLPYDCDNSQIITLALNGIFLAQNEFWKIIEQSYPEPDLISWNGLELQNFAQIGDKLAVSYYKLI